MKITAVSVLLLLSAAVAGADVLIVQEEEQLHPSGINKSKVTIKIKGDKVRIDRDPSGLSNIIDHATGSTVMISHHRKTYREISASMQKESMEKALDVFRKQGKTPAERPRLRATGKQDVVNGRKAEEYVVETKSMKATYWLAKDLLPIYAVYRKAFAEGAKLYQEMQFPDPNLFPGMPVLATVERDIPTGKLKETTKVLTAKETKIEDSEFSIPSGYKKE